MFFKPVFSCMGLRDKVHMQTMHNNKIKSIHRIVILKFNTK